MPFDLNGRFSSGVLLLELCEGRRGVARRKAGNSRNLHAISTQKKNKKRGGGTPR